MIDAIAVGTSALGATFLTILYGRIRSVGAETKLKKHRSKDITQLRLKKLLFFVFLFVVVVVLLPAAAVATMRALAEAGSVEKRAATKAQRVTSRFTVMIKVLLLGFKMANVTEKKERTPRFFKADNRYSEERSAYYRYTAPKLRVIDRKSVV